MERGGSMTDDLFSSMYQGSAPSTVSDTSALAASKVTDPLRARSYRMIVEALVAYGHLTRERLMEVTGIRESSLCARIFELRPTWVRKNDGAGKSSAGLTVDTYSLTDAGMDRWRQAGATP